MSVPGIAGTARGLKHTPAKLRDFAKLEASLLADMNCQPDFDLIGNAWAASRQFMLHRSIYPGAILATRKTACMPVVRATWIRPIHGGLQPLAPSTRDARLVAMSRNEAPFTPSSQCSRDHCVSGPLRRQYREAYEAR
jgi:hypothetical protein